jgi:NAD(P)-dependent dehydrogenase (short-subunit alcohol dehydrogenase family)
MPAPSGLAGSICDSQTVKEPARLSGQHLCADSNWERLMISAQLAQPVWFITGCSSGFGLELARLLVDSKSRVVVTARDSSTVADLIKGAEETALALDLDVTDNRQISQAVAAAEAKFGRIDILVNNAGYGYQSTVEEGREEQVRAEFDVNVFGLFAMTQAVLPGMRERRSGHIINITSVGGLVGFACSGYYAASKHAVEGWSDSLAAEVRPLGISVTCVEPGPFRTDWAGRSLQQTPTNIDDYTGTAGKRLAGTLLAHGNQPGDPVRAAAAMISVAQLPAPPRHLVLGAWGHAVVLHKMQARLDEIEKFRDMALATDYPEAEPVEA